ncbi:hypothetical protein FOA52_002745 [Chlamydomonas sp. UWO 241]|nr:hypothetical protein FOA52_002745 [Chlamydomonas sp. UWO 241]
MDGRWRTTGLFVLLLLAAEAVSAAPLRREPPPCATECHEESCDQAIGIRYGKFCGMGHGGCKGQKPCDSIDACCKGHDECVEAAGLLNANGCHKQFITCLDKHQHDTDGFSKVCPYDVVVPGMRSGIQMAMMFTSAFAGGNGGGMGGGMDGGMRAGEGVRGSRAKAAKADRARAAKQAKAAVAAEDEWDEL